MELAEINERLEAQLKNSFGIQLDRLPKDLQNLLEEVLEFQVITNLCDIDSNLIREWYIIKRKEHLDLQLKCLPIKMDNDSVKRLIGSEEKLIAVYEKVLEEFKSFTNSASTEMQLTKLQNQIQVIEEQYNKLTAENCEVNLIGLVEKIQMLNNKDTVE